MKRKYYIGVMSGTSMDNVDAVLVEIERQITFIDAYSIPIDIKLKEQIEQLCIQKDLHQAAQLDVQIGYLIANCINKLLSKHHLTPADIQAIGSHGQTVLHHPHPPYPYTIQIGDPNVIAAMTGITTVADFRRKDIAYGGTGAPLVPLFHQFVFHNTDENRAILNLGGICNVTLLYANPTSPVLGYDIGPANTLLDQWIFLHKKKAYDSYGLWAQSGSLLPFLLDHLLSDPYFHQKPPKSTGREYFNLTWLDSFIKNYSYLKPEDVQRTLLALTVETIKEALINHTSIHRIIVCGGGAYNTFLLDELKRVFINIPVETSLAYGIEPRWLEAMAWAWLSKLTLEGKKGNIPSVTGATQSGILGGIYPGQEWPL